MGRTSRPKTQPPDSSGRFAYEKLERVIHERAGLGIMTSLVSRREGLPFADLKELCGLTDGNLNRHLDVLREEGLIEIRKESSAGPPADHLPGDTRRQDPFPPVSRRARARGGRCRRGRESCPRSGRRPARRLSTA